MRNFNRVLIVLGVVVAIAIISVISWHVFKGGEVAVSGGEFSVTSTAFSASGYMPDRNTCAAENLSPPLSFNNVPKNAMSIALIMHDLDAPGGDFTHWLVWNIPPDTKAFNEGSVVKGSQQGTADFGIIGYGGPCPQKGTHHYVYDVYALDKVLDLPATTRREDLEKAMNGHVLQKASANALATRK
jgi:Raf kinase inhibitor-like YbhB/YbcL family protein